METGDHAAGGGVWLRLLAVLLLVIANGFFVAAEFALVALRHSRVQQMAEAGDGGARRVLRVLERLDLYISSAQLGITLASLALGWIGEPALAGLIQRLMSAVGLVPSAAVAHGTAAAITAYVIITALHITLGEQTPKSIALVHAERIALATAGPLVLFTRVMKPFIWLLNTANNGILRMIGVPVVTEHERVHSPEELRLLVMQARAHGTLDESDSAMLAGVFDFHDKRARDVMRPRTEVVAIAVDSTEQEVWELVRRERYTRYPVYRETLDDVVGVFLAKDLWLHPPGEAFSLEQFVREPLYVPDSRPAERVLDDLRKTRAQMAVVLDEYGGTAGIITMEDLVEEVIGDIADEYDQREREAFETEGVLELSGSISLIDVRSDYHLRIPEGDWTTLGGYVFAKLGRLPKLGDRVKFPGGELEVVAMDGRRVAALRVHKRADTDERGAA